MMDEVRLLTGSLKDFLTKPMLRLALLPFFIVGGLSIFGFFLLADMSLERFGDTALHIRTSDVRVDDTGALHTEEINATYRGSGILAYLISNPLSSGVVSFLVYTVGGLAAAMLSIYTALAVIGFLTPRILRRLRQKHYPDLELKGYGNPLLSLWLLVKSTLAAMRIFFLLIPLYFIPGLNLIAFNLPFYYLFHTLLTGEIAAEIMTRREALVIAAENKNRLRLRTLLLYGLSLVPFMWLIIPVFYVVYLGNGYLKSLEALRKGGGSERL